MKYVIQIFKPSVPGCNVGVWNNTAWGSDILENAVITANRIAEGNKMGIARVRVMEVITELICENVQESP